MWCSGSKEIKEHSYVRDYGDIFNMLLVEINHQDYDSPNLMFSYNYSETHQEIKPIKTYKSLIFFKRIKIKKEKWLVDICSHMVSLGDIKHRCIYAYEFSDNSVYVGLTFDIDDRKNRHKNDEGSAVYRHTHKTGIKPKLIKLTEYLEIKIAKKKEGEYVEKYKESGWIILNIVKTGGLGNMPRKWTKENCKNESLKYKTKTEFRNNNKSAYNTTLKYKWMDYVCSHMINKK